MDPRSQATDTVSHNNDSYVSLDRNINVLLAEDNKDNQSLISLYLSKLGANTDIADNGLEAVSMISDKYDLVLMDIHMPLMDGFDALKKIRADGHTMPVIAITANAMKQDRDNCLDSGFNDFIPKPVEKDSLYSIIKTYAGTDDTTTSAEILPIVSSILEAEPELHEIIQRFIGRLPGIKAEINRHFEENKLDELKSIVHSLKGSGGGMGYQVITDTCKVIEDSIKDGSVNELSAGIQRLNDIIDRVIAADEPKHIDA
jgi:CheY-like chemotaxis protein